MEQEEMINSNILENDAVTTIDTELLDEEENYFHVGEGNALSQEELFRFSIRTKVNTILVAGAFESGKTTLATMMYFLFLEGRNKNLWFSGSVTMKGFRERSNYLVYGSGKPTAETKRTSVDAKDLYLHLAVADNQNKKYNLFFTDASGEKFNENNIKEVAEDFLESRHVIVVVDGKKLSDARLRGGEMYSLKILLHQMLNLKIITSNTMLQVVCTKKDCIVNSDEYGYILGFWKDETEKILSDYKSYVHSINFYMISAMQIDDDKERDTLENIMCGCINDIPYKSEPVSGEFKPVRAFDRYQWRDDL
jgi:hypothetical protein